MDKRILVECGKGVRLHLKNPDANLAHERLYIDDPALNIREACRQCGKVLEKEYHLIPDNWTCTVYDNNVYINGCSYLQKCPFPSSSKNNSR